VEELDGFCFVFVFIDVVVSNKEQLLCHCYVFVWRIVTKCNLPILP